MTAAAKTRFLRTVNRYVAEFAGEAVVAIKQLAVDDDAAALLGLLYSIEAVFDRG